MKNPATLFSIVAVLGLAACSGKRDSVGDASPEAPLPKVHFDVEATVSVRRDYNQRLAVALTNDGSKPARIRVQAEGSGGLLADFAGPGSVAWNTDDVALEIPAGETWMLPMLVHADRADPGVYEVKLVAVAFDGSRKQVTQAVLKVEVAKPQVKWWTSVQPARSEVGEARLAKVLRIGNEGEVVSDLTVTFEVAGKPANGRLHWEPAIEEYRVEQGGNVALEVWPRLSTSFTSLEGELVLRGGGVEERVPVKFELEKGKQVYVTMSRCVRCSNAEGRRCTNRPSVTYDMPPVEGTPVDSGGGFGGGGGGGLRPSRGGGAGGDSSSADDDKEKEKDKKKFGWLGEDIEGVTDEGDEGESGEDSADHPKEGDSEGSTAADKPKEGGDEAGTDGDGEEDEDESLDAILDRLDAMLGEDAEGRVSPDSNGSVTKGDGLEAASRRSQSVSNKAGGRAHLIHSRDKDDDRIDLSFGISGAGKRLSVPIRGRIDNPVVAMPPGNPNRAVASYVAKSANGPERGEVVSVDSPSAEGKPRIERLSDIGNGKPVDSIQPVPADEHLDLFYREDGRLRHNRLAYPDYDKPGTWADKVKADLEQPKSPLEWIKDGIETGPVLKAVHEPGGDFVVATREEGGIALHGPAGREVVDADAIDINHLGDKRVLALRRKDGAIDVMMDGASERLVQPASTNSAPSLLKSGKDGLRLLFNREIPAEVPPEGASGLDLGGNFSIDYQDGKWGEPKREMMPEAPVDMAALVTSYEVPYGKSHYKKMNVEVKVNGRPVARLENKLPNGRYIHRVNPAHLNFHVEGRTLGNEVRIDTEGMSPGHYHYTDKTSLYTRHRFLQDSLVASSPEEAERLALQSDSVVRHEAPDLVVASNGYELPADVEPGATVEMPVALFNAGDVEAPAGVLKASIGGQPVAEANYGPLGSFRGTEVPVKIKVPIDWNAEETLAIEVHADDKDDADPETNKLNFFVLKKESPELTTGSGSMQRVDIARIPGELIADVDPTSEQGASLALQSGVRWFRVPVRSGQLGVDVEGVEAASVRDVRVFDEDGTPLGSGGGSGKSIYVRIEAGQVTGDATRVKFQWK